MPLRMRLAGTSPGAAGTAVSRPYGNQIVRVQLVGVPAALAPSGPWYGRPTTRLSGIQLRHFEHAVLGRLLLFAPSSSVDGATLVLQCALALRGVPPPRHLRSWEWDWNAAPTRRCEGGFDSLHAESPGAA